MRRSAFCALLLATWSATAAGAATIEIRCPAEPPTVRRLQLRELWRIDADDAEAPVLGYFSPRQVQLRDGRVYMLDQQLCHVLVYGDDGAPLDVIMHEGDGPGEVRSPGPMFFCADGRLAVQHGYPSRLEFVDVDGTPRGRWSLASPAFALRIAETPRGWFAIYNATKESDQPGVVTATMHVALHDDEGRRTVEYHARSKPFDFGSNETVDEAAEYDPWGTAVPVADGQVVVAGRRDEYRLEWYDEHAAPVRVAVREYPAHRRTADELQRLKYSSYSISNGELKIPDHKLCAGDAVISGLEPLPDGRLRVRTSRFEKDLPPGMVCRYEVHAATGELLERVEIYDPDGNYDVDYDAIDLLSDTRAMVLRNQRPTQRASINSRLHPELRDKLPPVPDAREDMAFTPIMCELVPYAGE